MPSPRILALLAAPCLLLLAGCSPGIVPVGGKVTYRGKPVTTGSIQFLAGDGSVYAAPISADGTYEARVGVGEAKVVISSTDEKAQIAYALALSAQAKGGAAGPKVGRGAKGSEDAKPSPRGPRLPASGSFSLIPTRYADFDKSGLKPTIGGADPSLDFHLTD